MNKSIFLIITLLFIDGSIAQAKLEPSDENHLIQLKREIPVVKKVDILVIGGTVASVAAAVAAAEQGAKVFLIAPRPYLGEDLCATLRLEISENRKLKTSLEKKIFGDNLVTEPLKVKATLNMALLDAGVEFVFGSYVTDVLKDNSGVPSGVIISNRAGRQVILAKVFIDGTDRAWVCRMAGAAAKKWHGKTIDFNRVVVMPGQHEDIPMYVTHKVNIAMSDLHYPSYANAEQIARAKTYTDGQLRASESLFHIPPDPIICKKNGRNWIRANNIDLDYFQPKEFTNLFVLSGSAGIPRDMAKSLLQPAALCEVGMSIGLEAANRSKSRTEVKAFKFPALTSSKNIKISGDVKENLRGLRQVSEAKEFVTFPDTYIPVLAHYDVVVVGGGTSGAPAAIAAARSGMKVLVIEYQEGLGGVGTLGFIGKPYHGRDVGFAAEVPFPVGNIEPKMEWYRSELKAAGGDIWLGVLGCGAFIEGSRVKGAIVSTPENRGVVLAKVVIDATGNADIAIAAGSDYMYGDIENGDIALQGTGMPSRPIKGNYLNTDYLLVDEKDMLDVWRTLVSVQQTKYTEDDYDAGTLIQNRERHRIVGDFILSYLDQVIGRTFPDAIVYSGSDYDSHGYPSSSYFALLPHDSISKNQNHPAPGGTCYTPYRCLLPKGLDGILVTGLGISMHRDASAMVRMQLDLANQGYAAGIAASMAINSNVTPREIKVRELQKKLVEKGNIPEEVMQQEDSYPLPADTIYQAVIDYGRAINPKSAGKPLAIILTHQSYALPLIKKEYQHSTGSTRLLYAEVLGMCGQKDGLSTLVNELSSFKEWDQKIFQGYMADYAHLPTPIDAVILSVGNAGLKKAPPQLLNLVDKLDKSVTLSHHRSMALALEKIADPDAAILLAELLEKPGMQGYAMRDFEDAMIDIKNNGVIASRRSEPIARRTKALREIVLARALYKCGDFNGLGKEILIRYSKDMRGLFAMHARAVLNEKVNLSSPQIKLNK